MITDTESLQGATVVCSDGEEIGTVDAIYVDTESGRPEWAGLRMGPSEHHLHLVPLVAAEEAGGSVRVPYTHQQVAGAPTYEVGRHLDAQDEATLFGHFGLAYDPSGVPMGSPVARPEEGAGSEPGERDPGDRLRMYWP